MIRTTLLMLVLFATTLTTPVLASYPPQPLAVPAFFSIANKSNGVDFDWIRLRDSSTEYSIFVADITALGSGTGSGCTSSPVAMFNCIHSAGRNYKILGYVNTAGGSRASNYVTGGGDGQAYITQWYNTYGGYIDGIFLDVGPATGSGTSLQSYYQGLHTSIVGHSGPCASSKACVMLNASQFEQDWVLSSSVANYVVTWEKPVGAGTNQYYLATGTTGFIPAAASQSPTGWYTDPAKVGSTSHLIYGVSDSVYSIASIVCKSQSAYGGPMLYVYDGTSSGYNHLPSYFETLAGNALNCPAQAQLPCGDGSTDSCGNNCGFGTYCTPGTGYCQDLGQYYGCQ